MGTDNDSTINSESILKLIKLPDLLSICNALLGFTAIIFVLTDVSEEAIKNALVLILVAAVIDGLDGMVARTIECSPMGKYLDSLADMISFGVAPAIVAYALLTNYLPVSYIYVEVLSAFGGAYVICGLLRLARFDANASLESEVKERRNDFVGFPITGSAIFLASVMLLAVEAHLSPCPPILIGLMCILCLLMTSRIRYRNIRDRRILIPVGIVFLTLFIFYIFSLQFVYPAAIIAALTAIYICSPLVRARIRC
ncbi:MAG TPA: CDP-diacylglycerol--serine O-phosphatidyltransferase [Methanophagales archaeon]|nr:CDP-diacylglycerol--serine O-phosphatidyltransferase [Methanophagales archaeon]